MNSVEYAAFRAAELISEGKQHLETCSLVSAVSIFSKSCDILRMAFGETAEECAEAYYLYGMSLLKKSKMETIKPPEPLNGEHTDNIAENIDENYNNDYQKNLDVSNNLEEDEEILEVKEREHSGIQEAWEMLELARSVYARVVAKNIGDKERDAQVKLSAVYLGLGEINMVDKNYMQAIEDITTSLEMRRSNLPSNSRMIVESLYQLGVARALAGWYPEAQVSLVSALKVLEESTKESDENNPADPLMIKVLYEEIRDKIEVYKGMEKIPTDIVKESVSEVSFVANGIKTNHDNTTVGSA